MLFAILGAGRRRTLFENLEMWTNKKAGANAGLFTPPCRSGQRVFMRKENASKQEAQ
jgi:hypothetical protein